MLNVVIIIRNITGHDKSEDNLTPWGMWNIRQHGATFLQNPKNSIAKWAWWSDIVGYVEKNREHFQLVSYFDADVIRLGISFVYGHTAHLHIWKPI